MFIDLQIIYNKLCLYFINLIPSYYKEFFYFIYLKLKSIFNQIYLYLLALDLQNIFNKIYLNLAALGYHALFFNNVYNFIYLQTFIGSYLNFNKFLDKGIFEYCGPYGIYKLFRIFYLHSKNMFPLITLGIFQMFLAIALYLTYVILATASIFTIVFYMGSLFALHIGLFLILLVSVYLILIYFNNCDKPEAKYSTSYLIGKLNNDVYTLENENKI